MTDEAKEETQHNGPEQHRKWRESYEDSLKNLPERKLLTMLAEVQGRLGTSHESAGDVERCSAIAHRLNNLQAAEQRGEGQLKGNTKGSV